MLGSQDKPRMREMTHGEGKQERDEARASDSSQQRLSCLQVGARHQHFLLRLKVSSSRDSRLSALRTSSRLELEETIHSRVRCAPNPSCGRGTVVCYKQKLLAAECRMNSRRKRWQHGFELQPSSKLLGAPFASDAPPLSLLPCNRSFLEEEMERNRVRYFG